MTDLAIARALHVLGVVAWIGGVAMVTTIVLPQGLAVFERFERSFARQARITSLWHSTGSCSRCPCSPSPAPWPAVTA